MKYKAYAFVIILFFLTVFHSHILSNDDSLLVNIPQPEEIDEAYNSGLLEYQDYIALLETVRQARLSRADSLFLLSFPDLQMGLSTGLDNSAEFSGNVEEDKTPPPQVHLDALLRNSYRLKDRPDRKNLMRIGASVADWAGALEVARAYDGAYDWNRRSISYSTGGTDNRFVLGNYSAYLGLGVVYGYHGRLLNKDADREESNKILFPKYGGGNGFVANWNGKTILADFDRGDEFSSQFGGILIPYLKTQAVIVGYGRVYNRSLKQAASSAYISLAGQYIGDSRFRYEAAVALRRDKLRPAIVISSAWKKGRTRSEISIWHYHQQYPSFFSGSISSRRSRMRTIDDIDFSYSNRRAGETGALIRTSCRFSSVLRIFVRTAYNQRHSGMNRIETEAGMRRDLGEMYYISLKAFYRHDSLSSGEDIEKKLQAEIIRGSGGTRTRLAVRYRFDRRQEYNYYTIYLENRLASVIGDLYIICKWDKLYLSDMKNEYMYLSLACKGNIGTNLRSRMHYSYRYNRGGAENYGTVRWDIVYEL